MIACNGPSLNDIDMRLLGGETVIALNRGYLKRDMPISYLVVVNKNVEQQWGNEIIRVGSNNIFSNSIQGTNLLRWTPDIPSFQPDITKPMWQGHTVTYVALQIAYYMGFNRVALIGCDHSFPYMSKTLVGPDINHFDPNYFPGGSKWDLPNLKMSEVAYKLARGAYSRDGRKIYNCSTFTKLDVFKRASLKDFIEEK